MSEEITSIRWDTVNGGGINTGIDNIVQGASRDSETVPEPSSMLGLFALGGFGIRSLLKRKSQ